jgi:ADP-ribose pyrophosphatase YjhB (NUDIX family)
VSDWRIRLSPMLTPLFRQYWRFTRSMTLGVRGIATDAEGRVLLIRHTYRDGWYLPGGGVESGQSAADAVVREMAEEGGVEAAAPPTLLGFYCNHAIHPNDHVALYRLNAWRPCPPLENGEIAERAFFALDVLPADTSGGTRRRLDEIFGSAPPTDVW